jgi:hypothetical protein
MNGANQIFAEIGLKSGFFSVLPSNPLRKLRSKQDGKFTGVFRLTEALFSSRIHTPEQAQCERKFQGNAKPHQNPSSG